MSIGFKNALLDSKKSYIRYISHELRTPLNTAYLGLKLLSGFNYDIKFLFLKDSRCAYYMCCHITTLCMVFVFVTFIEAFILLF